MESQTTKSNNDREIDIFLLFKSFGDFLNRIGYSIYKGYKFLIKNFIISILLILIGGGLAYYYAQNNKKQYKHSVLVVSNFGSNKYLYEKIENSNFLKSSRYELLSHVNSLEVSPIINVFDLVSTSEQYLLIARYMSDNSIDINRFKKNNNVELIYNYHILTYYTDIEDKDGQIHKALFDELNDDEYFRTRQAIELANTKIKLIEQRKSIANINGLFEKLGQPQSVSASGLSLENYSDMNEMIQTKEILLREVNKTEVSIAEQSKIIFDASTQSNIKESKGLFFYILVPLVLLVVFVFLERLQRYFRKYNEQ